MSPVKKFQQILITFLLLIASFYVGNYYGQQGYEVQLKKSVPLVSIKNKDTYSKEVDFALFWEVWEQLRARHLERPFDPQKLLYGAITGLVNSTGDPYSSFLDPEQNSVVTSAINGEYQGIGAELGVRDNQIMVVAPLDGSPAKSAGIMAGDKILQINGETSFGLSLTEAVSKIRGDVGTTVTLTIQRGAPEPFDVQIIRGNITISSVTWEDKGNGVAYVRISRFGGETNKEWNTVVSEINLKMNNLDSLVLDLRGNPGGYMDSAIHIASEFLKNGTVVMYQEDALGESFEYKDERLGSFERLPKIFVLIDGGSASASEILAAALKENLGDLVTLVGDKSFGKGTIQDARDFKDGSGLHLTVAKWLTPKKNWVHEVGIEPDVKVEFTAEDFEQGRDPQLDKVLELARRM
ncbi:S41 family peptidase [Patescibacteria group bacterium]|nr:S41 family peptidase [Patescibacteria group bacterium]HOM78033.1 S41 family peptidase [bacterium]